MAGSAFFSNVQTAALVTVIGVDVVSYFHAHMTTILWCAQEHALAKGTLVVEIK